MARRRFSFWAAAVVLLTAQITDACGDKLLIIGNGVRFQTHPASLVGYVHADSAVSALAADPKLKSALEKAGHKLSLVEDEEALVAALRSSKYDLVLTDASDVGRIEELLRGSQGPVVIIVMPQGEKARPVGRDRHAQLVFEAPAKTGALLSVIEKAMEARRKRPRA